LGTISTKRNKFGLTDVKFYTDVFCKEWAAFEDDQCTARTTPAVFNQEGIHCELMVRYGTWP